MDLVRPGFLTSLCLSLQLFLYLGTTCHNEGTVRDKISSLDVVQQLRLETLSLRFSAPLLGQPCKQLGSRSARGPSHNLPFLLLFLAILRLSTVHFQKPSLPWGGVSEEVVCSQPLQSWPPNQGLAMLAGGGPLERWAPGPSACILAVSTPAACARAHGSAPAGATTGGGVGGSWLRPVPLRVPAVVYGPGWAGPWRLRYSWSHPQTWLPHASQPVFLSGRLTLLHVSRFLVLLLPSTSQ